MMRRLLAICALFALAVPCFGGNDHEFNALVKAVERQYGVRHVHIPLLGLATFCLCVSGTPQMAGVRIAAFDDPRDRETLSADSVEQSVEAAMGSAWHPLVRARSRADGQLTIAYTNPDRKKLQLLIVSVSQDNATIVETKLKVSEIWKWIKNPGEGIDRGGDQPMHRRFRVAAAEE